MTSLLIMKKKKTTTNKNFFLAGLNSNFYYCIFKTHTHTYLDLILAEAK